ncbi:MAG: transposase [Deltaproteobacteria bacterium]|nr:transposase [Deltaproteobacteria bacterium]
MSHASTFDSPIIVFEKLTHIRSRAELGRKGNRQVHSWGFAILQRFVEYKALAQGIPVGFVDARYTSQKCSRCGHIAKGNRNGAIFKCKRCGFQLHSDLNASRSIAINFTEGYKSSGWAAVSQLLIAALAGESPRL